MAGSAHLQGLQPRCASQSAPNQEEPMDNDRPVKRDRYGRLLPGTATPKTGGRPKVPRSLRAASRAGEVPGAAWARWYSQRRLRPSQRVSATGVAATASGPTRAPQALLQPFSLRLITPLICASPERLSPRPGAATSASRGVACHPEFRLQTSRAACLADGRSAVTTTAG